MNHDDNNTNYVNDPDGWDPRSNGVYTILLPPTSSSSGSSLLQASTHMDDGGLAESIPPLFLSGASSSIVVPDNIAGPAAAILPPEGTTEAHTMAPEVVDDHKHVHGDLHDYANETRRDDTWHHDDDDDQKVTEVLVSHQNRIHALRAQIRAFRIPPSDTILANLILSIPPHPSAPPTTTIGTIQDILAEQNRQLGEIEVLIRRIVDHTTGKMTDSCSSSPPKVLLLLPAHTQKQCAT